MSWKRPTRNSSSEMCEHRRRAVALRRMRGDRRRLRIVAEVLHSLVGLEHRRALVQSARLPLRHELGVGPRHRLRVLDVGTTRERGHARGAVASPYFFRQAGVSISTRAVGAFLRKTTMPHGSSSSPVGGDHLEIAEELFGNRATGRVIAFLPRRLLDEPACLPCPTGAERRKFGSMASRCAPPTSCIRDERRRPSEEIHDRRRRSRRDRP